jgi:hypothetical protein
LPGIARYLDVILPPNPGALLNDQAFHELFPSAGGVNTPGEKPCGEGCTNFMSLNIPAGMDTLTISSALQVFSETTPVQVIGDPAIAGDPAYTLELTVPGVTLDPPPLPAALPLFATGLGALGLLGWRRKRIARVSLLGAA